MITTLTLRELMIEQLNYAYGEDELQEAFDYAELDGDLTTISDQDFLDIYNELMDN